MGVGRCLNLTPKSHCQNELRVLPWVAHTGISGGGQLVWWMFGGVRCGVWGAGRGDVGQGVEDHSLLACRSLLQANVHLSTINILSTNYFTWVSKSEDPSISV